jgi:hypothetical protein
MARLKSAYTVDDSQSELTITRPACCEQAMDKWLAGLASISLHDKSFDVRARWLMSSHLHTYL